ncbi:MAG: hypothetical protein FWC48_03145 [Actinomycetia bacterium]|nr:hypothetical protein [Actinomycetes bacterium]
MTRRYRTTIIAAVLVLGASVAFYFLQGTGLESLVVAVTAVIGAVAIWFQTRRSKDMAEGEFILALNSEFAGNEDIRMILKKLYTNERIQEEDRVALIAYLTFFETMYLLIRRDVLDIALLDDLFRERYVLAINNKDCQQLEIITDAISYSNLYTLDHLWTSYRTKHHIVGLESRLASDNPDYDDFVR